MRVITGKARGHKLKAPKGLKTRPTTDRVKESIFNILGDIPTDAIVLDLFAGSGNMGIEFLSRGAELAIFIDQDPASIKAIHDNIDKTKFSAQSEVYKQRVDRALSILGKRRMKFDYIFLDPPYDKNLVEPTIKEICKNALLKPDGTIIIEHETRTSLPTELFKLKKSNFRKYGDTTVSFYQI